MLPAPLDVTLDQPGYWSDIAIPGIAGCLGMAILAGSLDRGTDLGRNMGALQKLSVRSSGAARTAQHRRDGYEAGQSKPNCPKLIPHTHWARAFDPLADTTPDRPIPSDQAYHQHLFAL
jgi:hypothetical protein